MRKVRTVFTDVRFNALKGIINLFGEAHVFLQDDGFFTVVTFDDES